GLALVLGGVASHPLLGGPSGGPAGRAGAALAAGAELGLGDGDLVVGGPRVLPAMMSAVPHTRARMPRAWSRRLVAMNTACHAPRARSEERRGGKCPDPGGSRSDIKKDRR